MKSVLLCENFEECMCVLLICTIFFWLGLFSMGREFPSEIKENGILIKCMFVAFGFPFYSVGFEDSFFQDFLVCVCLGLTVGLGVIAKRLSLF